MAIVFMDIDGTIANATERFKKSGPEPKTRGKEYTRWLKKVQNNILLAKDIPVEGMMPLCNSLTYGTGTNLVYLTGRSEVYRAVTEKWLQEWYFPTVITKLLMRPKNSRQRNGLLKERLIKNYLKGSSSPVIVIDDDYNGDIEEVCHLNGWTFLKARSGGVWK